VYETKVFKGCAVAAFLSFLGAEPTMADGEFFQLDFAPGASTVVGSVVRGPVGAAVGRSDYDNGHSYNANVTNGLQVPSMGAGAVIRVGPTARLDQDGNLDLGAKVVFERWTPLDWGGAFVLADFNTIAQEYLLLGELAHSQSGLSASLAFQGDNNDFRETTLVFGYGIPKTRARLRLGYKFEAKQALVGFSFNTF